uniref:NADH-ubiquinone oxidoreductase chain 6 n=1 Tax=Mylabris sp. MYL01 TaxID=1205567 RepID=A0A0S2MNA8_9CUCU|nr:NADH deshydrogenase subunit 6 [Mylabris sp. MYL01]
MLIIMNLTLSLMFMFLNHPLSLGLILLLQTTIISMISGQLCLNYWFSYILFLIMVGGMLILFIYMTSIASNEKFKLKMSLLVLLMLTIIFGVTLTLSSSYFVDYYINNELSTSQELPLYFSMIKFINPPMNKILLFMILYLFLALIAIVKIINRKQGPLRPMN